MTPICPSGHLTATTDYCDQCGAKIGGAPPPPTDPASAAEEADTSTSARHSPCPACGARRSGDDRFCEGCGHDLLAPSPGPTAAAAAAAACGTGGAGRTGGTGEPCPEQPSGAARWEAVVTADRRQHERHGSSAVVFPDAYPPRCFLLGQTQIRIGRGRPRPEDPGPEINLGGAPADPGVSQLHAILELQPDASYSVRDLGSTNGTTLNDDPTPIGGDGAVALADGDRIHVGAWTTITLRRR